MIETLAGAKSTVDDPFLGLLDEMGGRSLQPHKAVVMVEAAESVSGTPAAG